MKPVPTTLNKHFHYTERKQMKILKLFRPFAHVFGAMVSLVFLSNLLSPGTFGATSLPSILLTALLLSSLTWLIYLFLGTTISACISFRESGILLTTLVGAIAGTVAISIAALLLPDSVLLTGFWAAVPFAFVGTLLTWVFAYLTGSLKKDLTFFPKR